MLAEETWYLKTVPERDKTIVEDIWVKHQVVLFFVCCDLLFVETW